MAVVEEDGGRLNTFAKEPKIEVMDKEAIHSNRSWLLIIAGVLLVLSLIGFTVSLS